MLCAVLLSFVLANQRVAATDDFALNPVFPFDPKVAEAFAALAQVSYCGAIPEVTNWTCGPCKKANFSIVPGSVRFIQQREITQPNSTFIYVARIDVPRVPWEDACVVAIRGSETVTNWIRDLEFWTTPVDFDWCDGCKIEEGWYAIFKNVKDRLVSGLAEIGCVPKSNASASAGTTSALYVTGHSLGAAVSTIAMCLLEAAGFQTRLSVSFESPRVGNAAFAAVFDTIFSRQIPVYRVTYGLDPVPHLPPKGLFGYTHVNYEVYYKPSGEYSVCERQEDERCANRYMWPETLPFAGQHCRTPLALGGDICTCPVLSDEGSSSRAEVLI